MLLFIWGLFSGTHWTVCTPEHSPAGVTGVVERHEPHRVCRETVTFQDGPLLTAAKT